METKIPEEKALFGVNPRYLKAIEDMCLFDDDLMMVVFRNEKCVRLLIRIILGRDDLKIKKAQTQCYLKNLSGRSVKLDILAEDNKGRPINIEIQNRSDEAIPRRARLHSSLIDADFSEAGSRFKDLPETYVIFITRHDVLNGGEPIYKIDRRIESNGKLFDDGAHIIYVNGENKSDTELGRLIQDLKCTDPDKFHNPELAEEVRYNKRTEEGVRGMSRIMEELIKEEREEIALEMIINGDLPLEKIAKYFGLTLDEVKALAEKAGK